MPFTRRPKQADQKAPDGFMVNGWRQVHRGGYVRFLGERHYHDSLAGWAGLWVFVEILDWTGARVGVWPDEPWKDARSMIKCLHEKEWTAA